MNRLSFRVPGNFDQFLNALEYLKLARSEEVIPGESKIFTFAHRRFQEYFATCVVLSDLSRINPRQLLSDGRWRETAVVIFQTQPPEVFAPILTEVRYILDEMLSGLSDLIDDPISYVEKETIRKNLSISHPFVWPLGLLHLLGLLQDGFISRAKDLHYDIQLQVGRALLSANNKGTLSDQKLSLEVAGITPQPILLHLLRSAFASDSQWLKEVAYRQTAKLGKIPNDIAVGIRKTLVSLFTQNRLPKEYFSTHAHLSRLDQSKHYINSLKLLRWVKVFDIFLHFILFLYVFINLYNLFLQNLLFCVIFMTPFLVLLWWSYSSLLIFSSAISSVKIYFKKRNKGYLSNTSGFDGYKIFKSLYPRLITLVLPWACFAILASDTGQFTHPIWWIFLLAFPFLFFVFNPGKILQICIYFFSDPLTYYIIFAYLVLFFLSFALNKLVNLVVVNLNAIPVFFIYAFLVLFMLLFFLSTYYFSKQTLKFLNCWLQDWIRYKKWIKNTSSITSKNLLDLISLYHTKESCTRLITVIRERNLLLVTEDSEQLIQELALELEHSLLLRDRNIIKRQRAVNIRKINTAKKWKIIIKNPRYITAFLRGFKFSNSKKHLTEKNDQKYQNSDIFKSWIKQYTLKDKKRLINLDSEFLDEINILLEQVDFKKKAYNSFTNEL